MFFSIAIAYYWRYLNIFRSLVARNNYKPKKYSMAKSGRVKLVTSLVLRGNAHTIPLIFTKIQLQIFTQMLIQIFTQIFNIHMVMS